MMQKGSDVILVDSSLVVMHEGLGWQNASIQYNAEEMIIPLGSGIKYQTGSFQMPSLMVQHYAIAPTLGDVDTVLAAVTLDDTDPTVVTTGIVLPDAPRVLSITGNQAGIAGDVVIEGTSIDDEPISETIALDEGNTVNGTLAFKTVTKITLPAKTGSGDTVSVGTLDVFGIPHALPNAALLLFKLFDGSSDAGTLAVDADVLELNQYTIAGTPDGAKVLDLYYVG
jgi:hypothetical protein